MSRRPIGERAMTDGERQQRRRRRLREQRPSPDAEIMRQRDDAIRERRAALARCRGLEAALQGAAHELTATRERCRQLEAELKRLRDRDSDSI